MRVTPIKVTDLPLVEALVRSRQTTLAVSPEFQDMHTKMSLASVSDLLACGESVGRVFGAFNDTGDLLGIVTVALSRAQPCYFIRKAYTSPEAPLKTLSELFTAVIAHYEALGYGRFYTMYSNDNIGLYHRLWRTASTLTNYVTYTDLVIPANVRPKHSDVWELLFGRSLYPEDMAIRGFIRKNDTMFFNEPT